MILAAKGKDKKSRKQLKQGSKKNISFSSTFVNFPANMSYTPTLGSKQVYTVSSTWGPKLSNNNNYTTSPALPMDSSAATAAGINVSLTSPTSSSLIALASTSACLCTQWSFIYLLSSCLTTSHHTSFQHTTRHQSQTYQHKLYILAYADEAIFYRSEEAGRRGSPPYS